MPPVFANRSSLVPPPDSRLPLPSQAPAAQRPVQVEHFPSFLESDFMTSADGSTLQTPSWLQPDGQVDYANMIQHMLRGKRSLQVHLVLKAILSIEFLLLVDDAVKIVLKCKMLPTNIARSPLLILCRDPIRK